MVKRKKWNSRVTLHLFSLIYVFNKINLHIIKTTIHRRLVLKSKTKYLTKENKINATGIKIYTSNKKVKIIATIYKKIKVHGSINVNSLNKLWLIDWAKKANIIGTWQRISISYTLFFNKLIRFMANGADKFKIIKTIS